MVSPTFPGFKYSNFQSSCLFSSMNDPFSSKCKGVDNRASSSRVQTGGVESANMESAVEDMFVNFSDMMNIDSYAGWCNSPLVAEQMLASYGLSTAIHSVPTSYAPYDQLNFSEPSNIPLLVAAAGGGSAGSIGSPFTYIEKAVPNQGNNYLNDSSSKMEKHSTKQNLSTSLQNNSIPRPFGLSLAERMLRALSLFKESSSGGILAQLWVPVKSGDRCILSTCEQPFLLDQMLSGYREVSRAYTFSADQMPGSFAGLPGRVFISKIPEWTSDVGYYSIEEYLRVKHAADHQVRGSIAIPIFSNSDLSCCAVLELVTVKEKPCFDSELESVCLALQAVNLRTTELPRLRPQVFAKSQCLSVNQRSAVAEIADVLRAVCHAHRLPLALAWIPCTYVAGKDDDMIKVRVRDTSQSLQEKSILCVEETACYVTDPSMEGFLRACAEHPLEEGQGVAGRALVSNLPFFFPDVKKYHIKDYPLAHHARKYGLNAAVAIRLRSTHTGHDDYVLEFFLPVSMSGNKEQQLLLDSLSGTMQRLCKSLRTVSEEELVSDDSSNPCEVEADASFVPVPTPTGNLQTALLQSEPNTKVLDVSNANEDHVEVRSPTEQITSGSKRTIEKKRSTAEKNVSLSVLQQYFSGSLKDAAKSIGVCPTTLKRICRQHGISRWPSRKINKVNRSLRKIQTVLDSVQGVEGGLKLDPATGEIVAGGSLTQELQARKSHFQHNMLSPRNREQAEALMDTSNGNFISENGSPVKLEEGEPPYLFQNSFGSGLRSIFQSNKEELQDSIGTRNCSTTQPPSSAPFTVDLTFPRMNGEGDFEHQQPSCSSMTDSSNGSGSLSSSQDIEKKVKRTTNVSIGDSESRMIVKALYKDDMIRFRFDPALGYLHLYDEVAKRFKLPLGMIQLKYLDDDDEWVLLLNEADFQECLELMDTFGTRSMKFLVREVPAATGSSGSSNCFLGGSL